MPFGVQSAALADRRPPTPAFHPPQKQGHGNHPALATAEWLCGVQFAQMLRDSRKRQVQLPNCATLSCSTAAMGTPAWPQAAIPAERTLPPDQSLVDRPHSDRSHCPRSEADGRTGSLLTRHCQVRPGDVSGEDRPARYVRADEPEQLYQATGHLSVRAANSPWLQT